MRLAAVTSCYNEPEFVVQFLRHYSPQVDTIYLFDNMSTDDTLERVKAFTNVVAETYDSGDRFDGHKKQALLLETKRACIGKYDYVLLLDCDEFVVSKDNGRSLKDALKDLPGDPVYGTTGYNMYQAPGDAPYDPSVKFTDQRKHGIQNDHYSKPIVVRPEYPVNYVLGCHYLPDLPPPKLTPFNLLHYKACDDGLYLERCLRFAKRTIYDGHYGGGGFYYYNGTEETFRKKLEYEKTKTGPLVQVVP